MENIYEQVINLHNTEELWDWIPGFENKYQISTYGRVKSFAGNNHGIILMPKITKAGYWYIHLSQRGDKPRIKTIGISRMVAAVFLPNPEDLAEVDHIDNQKWNNHIFISSGTIVIQMKYFGRNLNARLKTLFGNLTDG